MEGKIDKKRLIWPELAGLYEIVAPYSYALIRFAAGGIIVYHGYAKLILGFYPAVAMKVLPGKSRTWCDELVLGFLSTLSWVEERGTVGH